MEHNRTVKHNNASHYIIPACICPLIILIYLFQTLKRVRVGIGRPDKRDHVTDYVLSKFEPTEIPVVQGTVEKCCKVLIDELQLFRNESNDTKDTENSEGTRLQYHTLQQSAL